MSTYKSMLAVGMSLFGSLALRPQDPIPTAPAVTVTTTVEASMATPPIIRATRHHRLHTDDYLRAIANFESGNRIDRVNQFGMLGKYQFNPNTISELGFEITTEEFLSDGSLQDSVMLENLRYNKSRLRRVINQYNGTYRDGVYISTSGILAGAHLMGVGGVLAYFYPQEYDYPVTDGNGVHISEYIRRFGGYSIQL